METKEVQKTQQHEAAKPKRRVLRPRRSIVGDSDKVVLSVEMPGVKREYLRMNVENNGLCISTPRKPIPDASYIIRKRLDGDYATTYTLDETIDQNKIEAELRNGVLNVTFP